MIQLVMAARCSIVSPTAMAAPTRAIRPPHEGEPGARAVDDRLDGEPGADRQPGDARVVQQAPEQGLELSAQLIAPQPQQEPRA